MDHALAGRERAPARARDRRPDLRHPADQHDHERPRLEDRPRSSSPGTTGAASTTTSSRRVVDGEGYGIRVPALVISPYARHGLRRPPGPQLRRLPQVHRGRLPARPAARPAHRRPARLATRRARERQDPRQPRPRLRLRPEAPPAADSSRFTRRSAETRPRRLALPARRSARSAGCGSASACPARATRRSSPAARHPQDPARGRDHGGEPLVRLLLRHLSSRRRDPDEARRADRVRAERRRPVREAVPRPERRRRLGRRARPARRQ